MKLDQHSAYHGGSWKVRSASHAQDCADHWPFGGFDSEFMPLQAAMLFRSRVEPTKVTQPEKVQHLYAINWKSLAKEQKQFAQTLTAHKVEVTWLDGDAFPQPPPPNLMFTRDHFFMTPWGAVLGRMASPVRAGEEKWAQLALAKAGVPILQTITGHGTFEGADALWLNSTTVAIGIGNRSNSNAVDQIAYILKPYGIQILTFALPKKVQHLLGLLQIVAKDRALVRTEIAPKKLLSALKRLGIDVIKVAESPEVTHKQAMNIICLSTNRIIMVANCPEMKAFYLRHRIHVAAEIPAEQLLNAAGGLACALAPLRRRHCGKDGPPV